MTDSEEFNLSTGTHSIEEMLAVVENPSTTINRIKAVVDFKGTKSPLSNEGFYLDKKFISSMSKNMDSMNASYCNVFFDKSSLIKNKSLYLIMTSSDVPTWKKWIFKKMLNFISS